MVLVDLSIRDMDGPALRALIHASPNGVRIIALTDDEAHDRVHWAMQLGVVACLSKRVSEGDLVLAVRAAASGYALRPVRATQSLVRPTARQDPSDARLTKRQSEVAELLRRGLTNREIALKLVVSRHTVGFHLRGIYHRLEVANRTQAAMLLAQAGLSADG